MYHNLQFFIDGQWVEPLTGQSLDVVNPATEEAFHAHRLGLARGY